MKKERPLTEGNVRGAIKHGDGQKKPNAPPPAPVPKKLGKEGSIEIEKLIRYIENMDVGDKVYYEVINNIILELGGVKQFANNDTSTRVILYILLLHIRNSNNK